MASVFEDTNLRQLKDLLRQIHTYEMALPNFQRNFVWDAKATQELIVSIAKNYPAGSLLRIRNGRSPIFPYREFEGVKPPSDSVPTYLVLDGQQRLTSLYQAFHGIGQVQYFLDVRKLIDGRDIDECIFHHADVEKKARHYDDAQAQARELVMPLRALGHEASGAFAQWLLEVARQYDGDERRRWEDGLTQVRDQWISVVDHYQFPVVTLSSETSAEAVCTIFETLNRTGVKLTAFELLRARFFARGIDLRDLWAKACGDYPNLADFEVDPYGALQVIALITRDNPSCRYSDVLELRAEAIESHWSHAISGLAKALQILQEDCGVILARWLPYATMLVPMGATLSRFGVSNQPETAARRQKLVRWFWCSALSASYDNASDTQAARDTKELITWLDGGPPPRSVEQFVFDPNKLRSTNPQQRALYRAVMALLLSRKPRDFHTKGEISGTVIIEQNVDDHHIFPRAFLKKLKITGRLADCVLNRTLIDRATNRIIADRAPSLYIKEMRSAVGDSLFDEILTSHLIPGGANSPLLRNAFHEFLKWRQNAIWQVIQQVTGATEAADLLAADAVAEVGLADAP